MKTLRNGIPGLWLLGVAVLLAAADGSAGEDASQPMIVEIHADWCGTCTKLKPTIEALQERVGGEARIVVLDVTDRAAVEASAAEADRLGIRGFFDAHKGATGTVGVLAADGTPVRVMKGELDTEEYVAALEEARQS